MEFRDLFVILGSFQNVFNFFVSQKLLASCQQCSRCGSNMELTETTRVNDGYMWRCTNKRCRTWLSIRSGSFFEGSNIPLSTWLHLMFLWAMQISGSKIARLTSLSKPTVIHALSELRTICSNKVLNAGIKLGGLGNIHLSVNHSKNFVDPDSGAHTNTIEGVWALVKKKLKWMCGTLYEYIPSYLDEFTWFRNFGKDRAFEQLLEDIAEQFPQQ